MFERFTGEARQVVVDAQHEARGLHHGWIGTEHLLLGLLDQPEGLAAQLLHRHDVDRAAVLRAVVAATGEGGLDAEALGAVGIDLDAVRESVEAAFGEGALDAGRPAKEPKGHLPLTRRAKKVLELSVRESAATGGGGIRDAHLLLGLLREGEGLAAKVLHDRGVDLPALREEVRAALSPSSRP